MEDKKIGGYVPPHKRAGGSVSPDSKPARSYDSRSNEPQSNYQSQSYSGQQSQNIYQQPQQQQPQQQQQPRDNFNSNNSNPNNNYSSNRGGGGGGYSYGSRGGGGGGGGRFGGGSDRFGGNKRYDYNSNNRYGNSGGYGGGGSYGAQDSRSGGGSNRYGGYNSYKGGRRTKEETEEEVFKSHTEMQQGINFELYDKIPVEVSGDNPPEAIQSFDDSKLHQSLLDNLTRCHYKIPTPIQKYAIPCVLQTMDVMACAQTGSGKTAAFLLPTIHHLLNSPIESQARREPQIVIMSPTRELAIQIHEQARKFLFRTQVNAVVVYGGAQSRLQLRSMDYGCELCVATPGRLNDFIENRHISMKGVRFCILDEADRMLDMGFMPQITAIIDEMPGKDYRHTMMFSATFPLEIQRLAQEFLQEYVFIAVGRVGSTSSLITQKLRRLENFEKMGTLVEILREDDGLKLVFVETRRDAHRVEQQLCRQGIDAMSIHGDRSQREREHALEMFRSGRVGVLVATDVAARGLDIPNVTMVVNYDLPNNIDAYVHRIGRTGRCGNEGTAVAFVNEGNKPVLKDLLNLLRETKQEVPQWFNELVQRCVGYGRGNKRNYNGGFGARDVRRGGRGKSASNFSSRRYQDSNKHDNRNNNRYGSGGGNRNNYGSGGGGGNNDNFGSGGGGGGNDSWGGGGGFNDDSNTDSWR